MFISIADSTVDSKFRQLRHNIDLFDISDEQFRNTLKGLDESFYGTLVDRLISTVREQRGEQLLLLGVGNIPQVPNAPSVLYSVTIAKYIDDEYVAPVTRLFSEFLDSDMAFDAKNALAAMETNLVCYAHLHEDDCLEQVPVSLQGLIKGRPDWMDFRA